MEKDINEILDDFYDSLKTDNKDIGCEVSEILNCYSKKISDAINPLNALSAPFIYHLLKVYAKQLEIHFPDVAEAAECLIDTTEITLVIPNKK